jgi:4-alpha-glucanotransferase
LAGPAARLLVRDCRPMNELSPELIELAHAYGVATDYHDWRGVHTVVPRATVVAVLAALGVDATTPDAAAAAVQDRRDAAWRRMLPACVVTRQGWTPRVAVHVPHGAPAEVWVELEDGSGGPPLTQIDAYVEPRRVGDRLVGEATFEVPAELPLGWHELRARSGDEEARCPLVVTPQLLGLPASVGDGSDRVWGFMTQLYSVRSRASWGQGDLADLAELARWSADELGAGFVLVNPLHAPAPAPPIEPSPYLPVTRRFVSPLYLRVEDVPEWAELSGDARAEVDRAARALRETNDVDTPLDRDAVWEAKRAALSLVHAVPRRPGRQQAYERFREQEGGGLVDFATWCALAEVHGPVWDEWPEELRDPAGPAVLAARAQLADRVDFYCWLQWLADEQLATAQQWAGEAGMPLGVVHDLAVGVHPDGADTWALQEVLARGVTVGAPPDAFNQQGQDWSQPPWRPDRLAEAGYTPYRDMLRTILRHAGGVRVDHVLGLFRLWWVPDGGSPADGTYVRYDHEALVGILVLEAARAGALVVGEDLGVVEPWVRDYLGERGVLGTSILWFEREDQGRPLPPERWRELCLATVTTHDLPPTAGYLAGEHVRIRDQLGLLTRPVEEERRIDAEDREAWLALLRSRGWLAGDADEQQTVEALHRALAATPSRLLGVALTDAVGDRRAMNQPGTHREYPNWRWPLADGSGRPVLLEDLVGSPRAAALAAAVCPRRGA